MDTTKVKPPKMFIRKFLNKDPHYSLAAIVARIDRYDCPELRLSDCNHEVSFDLSSGENVRPEEWENTLYKLNTIIEVVSALRDRLARQAKKDGWVKP